MAAPSGGTYNNDVHEMASKRRAAAAAAAAVLLLSIVATRGAARAQLLAAPPPAILSAGDSPVVKIQLRRGSLTIRTWSRPNIGITAPASVTVRTYGAAAVARQLGAPVVFLSRTVPSKDGPLTLPVDEFPLTSVSQSAHQGVIVRSTNADPADVQIDLPPTTALVVARLGRGKIELHDYRSGTFALDVNTGGIFMQNVGGDGYAQVLRGPIVATDSSFDQLRARSAVGNIFFERCSAKQIQVSSIAGSIVYDNGSFAPGLARFESEYGNVALGVGAGDAQLAAHSSSGRIYANFDRKASFSGGGTDQQATLGTNGPVVTANSQSGAVYLYDGSFTQHRTRVGTQWRPVSTLIQRHPRIITARRPRINTPRPIPHRIHRER